MLLAIDTATDAVTVAVHDGQRLLAEEISLDRRAHTELLAPLIEQVLGAAGVRTGQLSRVAVGVGPGPFTGLRVGVVTARTLARVLGVEVVGVCTLDVLAQQAADLELTGDILVATDARRREVYVAGYRLGPGGPRRTSGPQVVAPALAGTDKPVIGAGARLYPQQFPGARPPWHPSAGALATAVASGTVGLLPPDPLYLRRPDAQPPAARKRVLG